MTEIVAAATPTGAALAATDTDTDTARADTDSNTTNTVAAQLTTALVRTLRRLGDAGEPVAAARIAAEAYVAIRHDDARSAERLNQVMHYLARLEAGQKGVQTMADEKKLDVRTEPPVRRHAVIFETFEALAPGEGFELVNDHDPKPLYYQLAAEQPGTFTWDYLESGPSVWRVRIGRVVAEVAAKGA